MAPWCHLLQDWSCFIYSRPYRWEESEETFRPSENTSTNIVDEPSTTVETNDDFPISVPNSPTAEPPPNDVPPRASEHPELRRSDHTRRTPQRFAFDIS